MALRAPKVDSAFRIWFPVTLILLLLLAIPATILLSLNLLGKEPIVNNWLQEHFDLTYHLLLTWWAALLLLLVPLLIVLLYFLKLKRKPLQVPSTFLWRKSIEDLHVNSLFQWLRENVLLLLQVLTVLLLIYTVLAFQLHGQKGQSKRVVIMIDNSASMAATDVAPNRLEDAKKKAVEEIDSLRDNDEVMVMVFASSAQVLQDFTGDHEMAKRVVEKIPQTHQLTRFDEALMLADSIANPNRSSDYESGKTVEAIPTEVHLFSDGRFPDADAAESSNRIREFARGNLNFQYHPIGRGGASNVNNVALVTLSALRHNLGKTMTLEVLVQVANYCTHPVKLKVHLDKTEDDKVEGQDEPLELDARAVNGEPVEGSVNFLIHNCNSEHDVLLYIKLHDSGGGDWQDDLGLDNQAALVVSPIRRARVLIVGKPDKVLHAFFDQAATQQVAKVDYLAAPDLDDDDKYRKPARKGEWDLVIFDRVGPEKAEDMPTANTWFIGCLPPPWNQVQKDHPERMPLVKRPRVQFKENRLFDNVDNPLSDEMLILEALAFKMNQEGLPQGTPRLLETEGDAAVMFTLSRQAWTDLVMTFPFVNDDGKLMTTWPTLAPFPGFMRNVLYQLGYVDEGIGGNTIHPADLVTLRPGASVAEMQIDPPSADLRPERSARRLDFDVLKRESEAAFLYKGADRLGIYRENWDGQAQRHFAVNLLDEQESNIEPRSSFRLGKEEITGTVERSQPHNLWKWVALAALGVLLLEWYIYNKRVHI